VRHSLARFSFSNKSDCNWVDEPPSVILDELLNDVTVIGAASFRRTFFLTRIPKRTGRFLTRWLASLIYYVFQKKYIMSKMLPSGVY
jgi:hypothetical protein